MLSLKRGDSIKTIALTDNEYVVLQKILQETSAADLPLNQEERQCQRRILRKFNAVQLPTVDIDAVENIAKFSADMYHSKDLVDVTGTKLTPSYHGKECLGNGEFVGYPCCCDNCDFYLQCFPEFDIPNKKPTVKSSCPATQAARAYLVGKDLAIQPGTAGYLQGCQQQSTTQITVRVNGSMKSIWSFDVLQTGETTGYRIRSYLDALDMQCTERHWQEAYHLLMDGIAKEENTTAEITKDEPF